MRIIGRGAWGPPRDRAESLATLRRVADLGINLIDTPESYSLHISEQLIADALHPYRSGLVVATKGGYNRSGPDEWQIGLSEVTVPDIQRAQKFFDVASVQNRYNRVDRAWHAVLEYCDRERIAFLLWSPLEGVRRSHSRLGRFARAVSGIVKGPLAIARIAKRHQATPAQVVLAWLLGRSPVILPIPGTSTREHLDENIGSTGIELSGDELAAI
jgi:aryl-alcohol dehydrogenase-like predicted oxidoreductase